LVPGLVSAGDLFRINPTIKSNIAKQPQKENSMLCISISENIIVFFETFCFCCFVVND
jgi:hypothetical protein